MSRAPRTFHVARACRSLAMGILLAATQITQALAQWSTESPLPTHLQINGVAAPTPGRVFLATEDDGFDTSGALFESNDGGVTWVQRDIPADLNSGLNGIFFLDSQHGWVWGNVNYRTTDGGNTWEELPLLGSAYFLEFSTPDFGVISGNFGTLVSSDGGLTWAAPAHSMSAFSFADAQLGLGIAETGIYRTTDGGASFVLEHAGVAEGVRFLSPTLAVAIVDDTLLRSTDAGQTWTTGSSAQARNRLFVVSPTVVLAWGRSGTAPDFDERILRSADGGLSWTDLGEVFPTNPLGNPMAFTRSSESQVIASDGAGNLFRSTDAGLTWTQTYATPGPTPGYPGGGAPDFADAQTGYFGFGAGFVVKTVDAGASWTQISSGSGTTVNAMDRFANGDIIAVGDAGQVLTRAAASTNWRIRATLGTGNLVAVQVIGPQAVVAVDQTGILYRSADAGTTWVTASTTPTDLNAASALHFNTLSEGWVIGQGFGAAALFHTTDGGNTWTPVPDFQGTYVAVDFVGTSGWAAAAYGTIYRTADAGNTWADVQLPGTGVSVADLDFWDANIGYAVGGGGYAARSSNGGLTWQVLPTPSITDQITDIVLIGPQELWVSTAGGKVMYSATGGLNWAVMDAGPASFGAWSTLAASAAGDAWIAGWQGRIRHFSGPPGPPLNQPPAASFSFLTTGLSVSLTDTSSDADGTVTGWSWDFGDGTTSTERHPTHLYSSAGTYHVNLTVTDDDGATDTALHFIVAQTGPGGIFGDFTEVTPLDPLFVTPQDEDFWVSAAAPADYDGDSDLDIVVLGYYVVYNESVVNRLVLLRNDGLLSATAWDFTYIDVPLGTLTPGQSDLAWADIDGDGDQDLTVGTDGQTVIYRNDAGTLLPTDTVLPGYAEDNDQAEFDLHSISFADYDNDGDLDLLLPSVWDAETFTSHSALMRNDGSNGSGGFLFTEIEAGLGRSNHVQSSWADFDGDQDLDLLITHIAPLTETGFIRRFRNDDGVFVGQDILGALTVERGEAQWGDYDDDGDLDILVAGNIREIDGSYDTVLRVYRNDAETYVAVNIIACVFCEGWFDLSAATWADYDSDGDIDILLAGTYNSGSQIEGRAKVYDNVNGTFVDSGNQLPAPRAMGFSGGSFSWLDIDGEGDLDYFIAGSYFVPGGNGLVETQMHLYVNTVPALNLPPSAPSALGAQVSTDGTVSLSWHAAQDDHTPPAALTYDLRVYRNGAPVSNARRTPEPGNLSDANTWSFTALPEGTYTWTLEAIDSAYNDSPAATATFEVGPPSLLFRSGFE
jgi:photosystem II stability/assembly factor-like uncharacterized protein